MKQANILVVATRPQMPDVRGAALQRTLQDDLRLQVDEVRTASLYTTRSAHAR
jgi:phosphoribosylformylglycinamidine (FGAM) synthase PurS component